MCPSGRPLGETLGTAMERLRAMRDALPDVASEGVAEQQAIDLERRGRDLRIPEKYRRRIADGIDRTRPAVEEARAFTRREDRRSFLFLAGGVGVGKSVAAADALLDARANGRTVEYLDADGNVVGTAALSERPAIGLWVPAFEVIQAGTYDREFWGRVRAPEVLVLDDLGAEPLDAKGQGVANLANLLSLREAGDRKTLITINATYQQFEAVYCRGPGQRIRDRLKESGARCFFYVAGESMRGEP